MHAHVHMSCLSLGVGMCACVCVYIRFLFVPKALGIRGAERRALKARLRTAPDGIRREVVATETMAGPKERTQLMEQMLKGNDNMSERKTTKSIERKALGRCGDKALICSRLMFRMESCPTFAACGFLPSAGVSCATAFARLCRNTLDEHGSLTLLKKTGEGA